MIDLKLTNSNKIDDNITLFDTQEYVFSFTALNIGTLNVNSAKLFIYAYKKDDYKVSIGEINLTQLLSESISSSFNNEGEDDFYKVANTNINQTNNANYIIDCLKSRRSTFLVEDFHSKLKDISCNSTSEAILKDDNFVLIPNNRRIYFTFFYNHLKKYKGIEFKLAYSCNRNSESQQIINNEKYSYLYNYNYTPFLTLNKNFTTKEHVNFRSLKVIPMLDNHSIIQNLLDYDDRITSKIVKYYCSEKYYVSFLVENVCNEKMKLFVCSNDSKGLETVHKTFICEKNSVKELYILINSCDYSDNLCINWELVPFGLVKGKQELCQVFKEFSFQIKSIMMFNITKVVDEQIDTTSDRDGYRKVQFKYKITNTSDKCLTNLRLLVYLYKFNENINDKTVFELYSRENEARKILVNEEIDNLIYEGYLEHQITLLKESDSYEASIEVYLRKFDSVSSTAFCLDNVNRLLYIPPKSTSFTYI